MTLGASAWMWPNKTARPFMFDMAAHDWPIWSMAIVLAMLLDQLGEPPARLHPVVWMGWALHWLGKRIAPATRLTEQASPASQFVAGMLAWSVMALVTGVAAWALQRLLMPLPWMVAACMLGVLLKPLFAWRMLKDETTAVETALQQSLDAGRKQLGRLVSRDVSVLDATQVREAALSTLAENLNDSVIAPLFWFALLGLPGAAIYRFSNTADAMWGYRGSRHGQVWEWAGKWAAHVDDVLSWIPARLTALCIGLLAVRQYGRFPFQRLPAEAGCTPSPNSGWPMAALALALDVHLRKQGCYVLHAQGRAPQDADMAVAQRICGRAAWTGAMLMAIMAGWVMHSWYTIAA